VINAGRCAVLRRNCRARKLDVNKSKLNGTRSGAYLRSATLKSAQCRYRLHFFRTAPFSRLNFHTSVIRFAVYRPKHGQNTQNKIPRLRAGSEANYGFFQ